MHGPLCAGGFDQAGNAVDDDANGALPTQHAIPNAPLPPMNFSDFSFIDDMDDQPATQPVSLIPMNLHVRGSPAACPLLTKHACESKAHAHGIKPCVVDKSCPLSSQRNSMIFRPNMIVPMGLTEYSRILIPP